LKGTDTDAFHALLCACEHNLRMILKKLRLLFASISADLMSSLNLVIRWQLRWNRRRSEF